MRLRANCEGWMLEKLSFVLILKWPCLEILGDTIASGFCSFFQQIANTGHEARKSDLSLCGRWSLFLVARSAGRVEVLCAPFWRFGLLLFSG